MRAVVPDVVGGVLRWSRWCACSLLIISCDASITEPVVSSEPVAAKLVAAELSVGIRPIENQLSVGDSVEVVFYLSNGTAEAIEILPWATPLEVPLSADLFTVTLNDTLLPYAGRVIKRAAPTTEDYTTLAPGESRETVVNLSQAYDMRATGSYSVTLKPLLLQAPSGTVEVSMKDASTQFTRQ